MKLQITTYALVKDFFGQHFELEVKNQMTVTELKEELIRLKPESAGIINKCRFAVYDTIVGDDVILQENADVHIIPPSSGG